MKSQNRVVLWVGNNTSDRFIAVIFRVDDEHGDAMLL
jgi:hypothetical protein